MRVRGNDGASERAGRRSAAGCWLLAAAFAVAACFGPRLAAYAPAPPALATDQLARDVGWLAADAREGRGLGTRGLAEAARYIARAFRAAGLEPGADGSYFQEFEMPVAIRIADAELALDDHRFERGRDFEAFLSSADGEIEAEVVFAGYGISEPSSGFDEYEGLDARGKIVLLLDHRPANRLQRAPSAAAHHLRKAYKIGNARDHGAIAVLYAPAAAEVPGLPGGAGREEANPTIQPVGLPVLAVSRETARRIVAAAGGPSLDERQRTIDVTGRPASARLRGVRVRLRVRIARRRGRVANVVGVRRGSDARLAREALVIGAHYDHLGHGEFGSLAPDRRGEVHNGADDNASGSAGLLALARLFGRAPPLRRTLVLVAFVGEEAGLVGSSYYATHPVVPLADTIAMINLDMIGRLHNGRLIVFGSETSPDFEPLVRRACADLGLTPSFSQGGFGPSDQTSFASRGLPVLFFFTGVHSQYHTPDDDVERLNLDGESRVLAAVYRVAYALLQADGRPRVRIAERPARTGGERGYGPYLGTIPDFGGPPVRGVRLAGVRKGSPAEVAGLRAGDVIVEFDGASVTNLEEYAALLFAAEAGQRVEIVVERGGHRITVHAVLGQRR